MLKVIIPGFFDVCNNLSNQFLPWTYFLLLLLVILRHTHILCCIHSCHG